MIHFISPYRSDKDLGKAYNDAMKFIPDGDWACITDYDVLPLLPDFGKVVEEYTKKYPDAGMFTCYTNRIGNPDQQMFEGSSHNANILYHIDVAEQAKEKLFEVTEIKAPISGFLMVINKDIWNDIKFPEGCGCLGVDNVFSNAVASSGRKILRMESVYVFHIYRFKNGTKDKSHLH